jgi:Domain of unknown function (DUF5069)
MSKPDPASLPPAALEQTGGLTYFPRLTAKIRLHAEGKLWSDLHANLGKGLDQWLTGFLHVDYDALKARVLAGGTDEEILTWCKENGRPLNETDLLVWNAFASKLGWNDFAAGSLQRRKADGGLSERHDIETIPHYIDVDEGRRD